MATEHHTGGCQCGKVRYEVDADLDSVFTCNCSRCERLGVTWAFGPASDFTLLEGEGETTEYLFNKGAIRHQFCKTCGIESYALGTHPEMGETFAVNVNCLDGVDPRALSPKHVDGASS